MRESASSSLGGGSLPSVPKQVSEPVWQVGPVGRTRTSQVSASQSALSSTSSSVLPEVSPFFHKRARERDQKCTCPVSRVFCSASSSM